MKRLIPSGIAVDTACLAHRVLERARGAVVAAALSTVRLGLPNLARIAAGARRHFVFVRARAALDAACLTLRVLVRAREAVVAAHLARGVLISPGRAVDAPTADSLIPIRVDVRQPVLAGWAAQTRGSSSSKATMVKASRRSDTQKERQTDT